MERVAKLLGEGYRWHVPPSASGLRGWMVWPMTKHPMTDGDLLLAILNKAADMGHVPALEVAKPDLSEVRIWPRKGRTSWTNFYHAFGKTPLEAAIAAFVQLPEQP